MDRPDEHPDQPEQPHRTDHPSGPQAPEPPTNQEPEAAPARRRAPLIIGAAVAVLAVVAGIAWYVMSTSAAEREQAIRATATAYLTALGSSDADAALAQLAEAPANKTLLTDSALQASNQATPLTAVEVTRLAGEGRDVTVDVTYQLGDRPVETTLALTGGGTQWKITDGVADLTTNETRALTVNGATLTEATNPVFPGSYTATSTTDLVALSGESTALVTSPGQEFVQLNVSLGLSEVGRTAVVDAVRSRFDECLASTESRPANCPFGVSTEGVEVTPGSVKFTLNNDPWPDFNPAFDPATMTAGGTFTYEVVATAEVTLNGLTTEATTPLSDERGYNVDLTQDPLVVTWG